jgi:predicted outer membrane protein
MKMLLNLFVEAAFCCLLLLCITCSTGNESVRNQPVKENEATLQSREARFVTSALEQAYTILELAQLANARSQTENLHDEAQKIIDEQTCIIDELKVYAREHHINVPISAPERARTAVKNLYRETSQNFDHEWIAAISQLNRRLVMDFESYRQGTTATPVDTVIRESLVALRRQHDALEKYTVTSQF